VGDGSGFFAPAQIISFSWPSFDAAAGDVNGDGNLDVIVAMDGYRDTVYFGNGAGSFEFAPVWPINPPNYNTRGIALADLDGDGDLDGFAANFGQPDQVYLNDGSGSFSILRAASFAYQSFGVALGQLDGK
jgi:hypothetical protein